MMNLQIPRFSSTLHRGLRRSGVSIGRRLPHAHACPAKKLAAHSSLTRREPLAAAAGKFTVAAVADSSRRACLCCQPYAPVGSRMSTRIAADKWPKGPCRVHAAATEQAQQIPETKLNNGAKLPLLGLGKLSLSQF